MNIEQHLREKKGDIFMKKKILTVMLAGVMAAGMSAGSVQAATTEDASGDLYVFIAASLANAMDEIQKDFNEEYPDVNILFNADSSGTLQTQIEEGSRCDIFFSAASKQMDALVDEELAKKDSVVDLLENKVVLIKPKDGETKVTVTEAFDLAGGELDRSKAYDYARAWLEPVLEENPSIQILIDLHRDGVPEDRHLVTEINGKPTAQIMFYNGLSHTINSGDLSYLPNPYIQDNLAFSFQLEYQAALYYPELYRGIYLAGLRYNLHLRPRALLLEAGAQTNTVQEVKNAMDPFADILNRVLQGEN